VYGFGAAESHVVVLPVVTQFAKATVEHEVSKIAVIDTLAPRAIKLLDKIIRVCI
jgi:hypothetical protein